MTFVLIRNFTTNYRRFFFVVLIIGVTFNHIFEYIKACLLIFFFVQLCVKIPLWCAKVSLIFFILSSDWPPPNSLKGHKTSKQTKKNDHYMVIECLLSVCATISSNCSVSSTIDTLKLLLMLKRHPLCLNPWITFELLSLKSLLRDGRNIWNHTFKRATETCIKHSGALAGYKRVSLSN